LKTTDALEVVSGTLRAMAKSSNADELCDYLANEVLSNFDVVATYLAILETDGRVTMVGSWGYPEERRSPDDRPSLWYPMAITDTIRTGEIEVYPTWDAYVTKYPHLVHRASPGKSFVCVPFSNLGRRAGGLGLTFGRELTDVEEFTQLWEVMGQAGDLFVSKSWAGGVFKSKGLNVEDLPSTTESVQELREQFSSRDLEVVRLTLEGMTVTEIAHKLRFSESTIKQARMAVYKRLGVNRIVDLKQAVERLGLLD
jgi:DNA-binding CsgD family transcriptional regulator